MTKLLFALPLLLLSALPAEAGRRHNHPRAPHKLICDHNGCVVKFRQPRIRISDDCVYKPWNDRIVCRY